MEEEREGLLGWRVIVGRDREEAKRRWVEGRKERKKGCVVGVSDASGGDGSVGIGGKLWEDGEE